MAEGAERFRGLWEDEMFARQAGPVVCVFRKSAVLSPDSRRFQGRFLPYYSCLLIVQLYCI